MSRAARRAGQLGAALAVLVLAGLLAWLVARPDPADPIVGSWTVTAPDAPFPYYVFTFHQDGTMSQANPDAGDQQTSDSDGAGTWTRRGRSVIGVFAETTADRHTGTPVGTGRISFTLAVTGDQLTGTAAADFYDTSGQHVRGPLTTLLSGQRIRSVATG